MTSETVQAARGLLRISGRIVDTEGSAVVIDCDCVEMVDFSEPVQPDCRAELIGKRVRLTVEADACPCGDRDSSACPGQWEPGCDLGANEAHAVPAPPEAALALREAMQPAAAPEDAERAAYLARWANAPEWAEWLAQDPDGRCDFFESMPSQDERGVWMLPNDIDFYSGAERFAGHDILGPFRCEARPVQGVEG